MKATKGIAIFILLGLLLVCCDFQSKKDYVSPGEQAKIWVDQVIECFINKDADTLKSLFCVNMQNESDLDEQIQELFEFIDGEIVSYGEPFGTAGGGVSTEENGIIERSAIGEVRDIVTDKGTTYQITLNGYVVYEADKNNLGIGALSIRNVDLFNYYKDENPRFYIEDTPEVDLVEKKIRME